MHTTRREFLATTIGSSAVVSLGAAAPSFLLQATADDAAKGDERILVVVQLSGGNDGLNTVVPFTNEIYRKNRPTLAVSKQDALKIDGSLGFHPAARGLADLLETNQLGIVQGIGYPNPNRSHFESMDIWHTCRRKTEKRPDGWLGRFLEAAEAGSKSDIPALHLGHEKQPYALASLNMSVPSIQSIDRFRLRDGGNEKLRKTISELGKSESASSNDLLGFVKTSTGSALAASRRIEAAGKGYKPKVTYPENGLGQKLQTVAQLIDSKLATRVFYVTLDGFDTHSRQADAHAALLREFSSALSAFIGDINSHGHGDRVLVMGYSEFGRRLKENASEGTDHGAAAPMFMAGKPVRSGLIGRHPSLTDLTQGDVKFHTDFRQVYAAVLENWLGVKSAPILGAQHKSIDFLQS